MTTTTATSAKKIKVPKKKEADGEYTFHPLEALIPDPSYVDAYVGRQIGGVDDVDLLESAMAHKHNVLIEGPTGVAKTTMVYAYAAKKRLPLVNIACNGGLDADSTIGGPMPNPDRSITPFVPGDLTLAVMFGGIAYFDEINMMPPRIAAAFHGLTDSRRVLTVKEAAGSGWCGFCSLYNDPAKKKGEYESNLLATMKGEASTPILCDHCGETFSSTRVVAHKNFLVVGAYNPGYEGTFPLNEAFKNRFAFVIDFGYNQDVEKDLLYSSTLIDVANQLRARVSAGDLRTPVGTNKLMEFEELALDDALGFGFACENFLAYFHPDERQAVREVLSLYAAQIETEVFA
jgi:nitric oxide reductase NorQ protein